MDDGFLVPVAFFITVVVTILGLARIISEGRLRRRLIEAGGSADVARSLAAGQDEYGLFSALKWGIVAVGVGLAFVIVQFLPYDRNDPIMFGVVLLFLGASLLAYYVTARRIAASRSAVGHPATA